MELSTNNDVALEINQVSHLDEKKKWASSPNWV